MAIPVTEYIQISINLASPSGPKFGFGSLMGVFEHDITLTRKSGPYSSVAALVTAGFTSQTAPSIYAWATEVFSQPRGVDRVLIGRRIPTDGGPASRVWQVDISGAPDFVDETSDYNDGDAGDWAVFPTVEGVGDYAAIGSLEPFSRILLDSTGGTAGTDGVVVWEYWNGETWFALSDVVDDTVGFTAALSAAQEVSWTVPIDWAPLELNVSGGLLYYVRARVTTVYTVNPLYTSGTVGGDATWTVTMDKINASLGQPWYITNIESRSVTPISAVAAWTEAQSEPKKVFFPQSSQAAVLTATAGNIAESLQDLAYDRTALVWHGLDAQYADGGVSSVGGGLNLDAIKGVGIWGFKPVVGVTSNDLPGSSWANIFSQNANAVGSSGGRTFFTKGRMASGRPIDIITTSDWLEQRIQEALLDLFVTNPTKVPFEDPGIQAIVGAIQTIFDNGVAFGHFAASPAPVVTAPIAADISSADKEARVLSISATATLSGAIESVIPITIELNF